MALRKLYRSYDIAVLDENSEYLGVSRTLLMENAGARVAHVVSEVEGGVEGKKVLVVAGPGNNGGDAFVAARHLAGMGARVAVILLSTPERIRTREARDNWSILERMCMTVERHVAADGRELMELKQLFGSADVIVDGIFGTGIRGEVREPFKTAISLINSSQARVYSVDVPSGVDPDTGSYSLAVRPHITITLHGPKPFTSVPGVQSGQLYVEEIGAPPESELIAGPGDLSYVRSRLGVVGAATVRGSGMPAEGARDALTALGIKSRIEEFTGGLVVELDGLTVTDTPTPTQASVSIFVLPHPSPRPGEALATAQRVGRPVYLLGGHDGMSDGSFEKSNWIEPEIVSPYHRGVVSGLVAYFAVQCGEALYCMGAACYAARAALRGGGASSREAYLERLKVIIG